MPWEQTEAKIKEWFAKHKFQQAEIIKLDGTTEQRHVLPQRLAAQFAGPEELAQAKSEDRSIGLTWYTGATVKRFGWDGAFNLKFSMKPEAVRLDRLKSGAAPILNSHRDWDVSSVIGVIETAWIEGENGKAMTRFAKNDSEADAAWNKIEQGILRNASMGAMIYRLKETTQEGDAMKSFLVTDWEPQEVSLVAIGSDPGAAFRASGGEDFFAIEDLRATGPEEETMEEKQLTMGQAGGAARNEADLAAAQQAGAASERARSQEINRLGALAKLDVKLTAKHISDGTSIEDFRKVVLDTLAERSEINPQQSANAQITRDEGDTRRQGMTAALLYRYDPNAYAIKNDLGRDWMGLKLIDIGRECAEANGKSCRRKSPMDIVQLALSTSDFPYILADVANKTLRAAYEAYPQTFKPFCRQTTAADFKNINAVQLSEAPGLLVLPESGEFQRGSLTEGKETYRIATYGRLVSITRRVIVNDDLGAMTRIPAAFGVAAATLESDTVWGIITTNGNMGDAHALFDNTYHFNLLSGAGSALALAGLGAAMTAMTKQKGLDAVTFLNLQPKFLLIPVALQLTASQLIGSAFPAVTAATVVPEYMRALTPIAEPRLDAISSAYWYLAASPAQIDTIFYTYLEGQQGVYTETRQGFEVDGVDLKVRLDFGAAAIDWRGLQRNNGA